jgi:uncharacterized protein YndB with AHSA1/START domain
MNSTPHEPNAKAGAQTGARKYEQTLSIAAPPEAVWSALTSDIELKRWFPQDAEVKPGPGGTVVWKWGEIAWPQRIEIWKPNAHLRTAYDSSAPDGKGGKLPLYIDFTIEAAGGKTTLRMVHSGFGPDAAFDQEYDGISRGWPVELGSLKHYLENHAGKDRQIVWCLANVGDSLDAAFEKLMGPGGFACGTQIAQLKTGDAYKIKSADGDAFEGTALHCQPREFSGVVRNYGNAFARLCVENCGGAPQAWLWLAAYGQPPARLAELEKNWKRLLARVFPGQK